MTIQFNINGAGFKGATVDAVEAGYVGFYHGGKVYQPNRAQVRALLPYRWRKAFDSSGSFWFASATPRGRNPQAHVDVRGYRGRHLTTVYANVIPPT